MRGEKRKPRAAKADRGPVADASAAGGVSFRRSREAARRLIRRGVFNKRIVEDAARTRGRG